MAFVSEMQRKPLQYKEKNSIYGLGRKEEGYREGRETVGFIGSFKVKWQLSLDLLITLIHLPEMCFLQQTLEISIIYHFFRHQ